jgi:hypothetical protein
MALIDNCVAYYKFDETSGSTADNAEGTASYDGTISGATINQTGKMGKAFSFDGTDDEVQFSSVFGMTNSSCSINLWVNLDGTSKKGAFVTIGKGKALTYSGYSVGVGNTTMDNTGNNLIILFENVRWFATGSAIGTGWHMVTLTLSSTGVPQAWIDGSSKGTSTGTSANNPATESYIGGYTQGVVNRHVNALIDEVVLWTKELSSTEVTALYNSGDGLTYPFTTDVTVSPSTLTLTSDSDSPLYLIDVTSGAIQGTLTLKNTTTQIYEPNKKNLIGTGVTATTAQDYENSIRKFLVPEYNTYYPDNVRGS